MVAAANGVGGDGCVRVRAREKEQRGGASRKSERVRGGGVASPGVEEGGNQAGGGARRRARPTGSCLPALAGGSRWLARASTVLGRLGCTGEAKYFLLSLSLLFLFCFIFFFCFCFI